MKPYSSITDDISNDDQSLSNQKPVKMKPEVSTNYMDIETYTNIREWSSTSIKLLIFILYYIVGIIYYHVNEGWDILDCVYYITVTVTTVG